jgi:thioredoxin-related protein
MKFLLTFLFFVVTNIFLSQTYKPNWILDDFNKAYNKALKEDKPLFIYFTSDGWGSEDLNRLIINTKQFKEWSDTNFVLLKLYYKNTKNENPTEVDLENEKIRKDFANMGWPTYGFPSILLVEPMVCEELHVYLEHGLYTGLEKPENWIKDFMETFNRRKKLVE